MMSGALGGMAGSPFMSLFWLVIIVAGIYFLARMARGHDQDGTKPTTDPGAEELLKRRYARGDISREDYESMLRDLRR